MSLIILGTCLFLPGCFGSESGAQEVICEWEESLEENQQTHCSFEMLEAGTITIDVEVTGDTPVTILTIPGYGEYQKWWDCEEFDYYIAGSKVDSMSTTLEFDYQMQELDNGDENDPANVLYVVFWNSDWPNSCDVEENGPTVNFSFKISATKNTAQR